MNIRDLRKALGDTQSEFSERYQIPFRTIQNWEADIRKPPKYIEILLEERVKADLVNRRAIRLPKYDSRKKDLPNRKDYIGAISWLKDVRDMLGPEIVFALDESLMCQGLFGGRSDESIIWIYGNEKAIQFNGVVIVGNQISSCCVEEKDSLKFTDFNRTLCDAFANEALLDMQGITEAVSRIYYTNGESLSGVSVAPEYQDRFDALIKDAIDYYES